MIVFADKQDITRVGLIHVADSLSEAPQYRSVEDKATLIETLNEESDAVVYLDYTMFDINDVAELQIIAQRFPNVLWVLFCDELSYEFINQTVANNRQFGIVMKDSPLYEIRESMMYALRHQRFIYVTYKKATEIVSGEKYLIVAQRDGNTYYAMPCKESYTYGDRKSVV